MDEIERIKREWPIIFPPDRTKVHLIQAVINANRDIDWLLKCIEKLEVENRIRKSAVDRWVPCPDHRDKVSKECYVCKLKQAESKLTRLVEAVEQFCQSQYPTTYKDLELYKILGEVNGK